MNKKIKKLNNYGITHHLLLLILAIAVLGATGFAGFVVYKGGFSALADNDNSIKNRYFSNCPPELDNRPVLKNGYRDSKNTDKKTNKCGRALQYYLKNVAGYDLDVDGWFGPQTEDRLKRFQKKYSIVAENSTAYGTSTKATWEKLDTLQKDLAAKLKREYKGPLAVWFDANSSDPTSTVSDDSKINNNGKYKYPLLIGASYTLGMKTYGGLRAKLDSASLPVKINARGGRATVLGKDSAQDVLIETRKNKYTPDLVMIQTGINDLGLSKGLDNTKNFSDYKKWITTMMDEVDKNNKIPVIWFTVTREKEKTKPDAFNKALRDVQLSRPNLTLVDWVPTINAHPEWYAPDGVHYSSEGYQTRAKCTVKAFQVLYQATELVKEITC